MPPFAARCPRLPGLALGAGLATVAVLALAQPAAAYETFTSSNCAEKTWMAQPRVVVHTGELPTGPEYFGESLQMLAAVNEVVDDFNRYVTASAAEVTSVTTSTEPFTQNDFYGDDPVPTVHIGFRDTGGLASGGPGPTVNCQYDEAHIGIKNLDLASWQYGLPEDGGQEYYDSLMDDDSGARYFRLVVLHELMHTFGLAHNDTDYSMMNYGDRPWFSATTIRPLPDDVEGLRALYPAPNVGSSEVAVFNTWWSTDGAESGAAQQEPYCDPSLGDVFTTMFSEKCGTAGDDAGSTQVCTGSTLRSRYTVANYSTEQADVTARLWLSTDDRWDSSDRLSPTRYEISVDAADSETHTGSWELPNLGIGSNEYHPIIRLRGTTDEGRSVEAWTPQRGTVDFDLGACLTPQNTGGPITGPFGP